MIFKERFEMSRYGKEYEGAFFTVKLMDKNQTLSYYKKINKLSKQIEKVEDSLEQSIEIVELMYKNLEDCFLGGQVFDDSGSLRDASKEDISTLPTQIAKDLESLVMGKLEKKS